MRYVTVKRAAELIGMTEAAIRRRCERGTWQENRHWRRGPDGRIWIDLKGIEQWVEATA